MRRATRQRSTVRTNTGVVVKSRFEKKVADELSNQNVKWVYEKDKVPYTVPSSDHVYTPDFKLRGRSWVLECKGVLDLETRKKMLCVKASNPDLDVRLLFQRDNPLRKGSKTTYGMWATANGFRWAVGSVPKEWIEEE